MAVNMLSGQLAISQLSVLSDILGAMMRDDYTGNSYDWGRTRSLL